MGEELKILISAQDAASGVLKGIGGTIADVGKMALGIGVAGFTGLAAGIGASVKAAMDSEKVTQQLDAVLKSTASSMGTFSTKVGKMSDDDLQKLKSKLGDANDKLALMQQRYKEAKHPTESMSMAIKQQQADIAALNAQLVEGSKTFTIITKHTQLSRDAIIGLSESLSKFTPFEDDAILSGENMLLTFTNIGKDVFPAATETMLDMSQALGQDLKSSAIQLGKALNDPVQGVTALQRVGVSFTDSQKAQIEAMVASGRTMDAQKLILKELQTEFGGSAKAAGQTFAGQLTILQNSIGNVMEDIGNEFLPILKELTSWVNQNILPVFKELADKVIPKLANGLGLVGEVIGSIFKGDIEKSIDAFSDVLFDLAQAFGVNAYSAGDFSKQVHDALSNVVSYFGWLADSIKTGDFSSLTNYIKEELLKWVDAFWEYITDPSEGLIANSIRGFADMVRGWADWARDSNTQAQLRDIGRGLITGVTSGSRIDTTEGQEVIGGLVGVFKEVAPGLFKDLMDLGYILGKQIALGMVDAITDGLRDWLHNNTQFGRYFVQPSGSAMQGFDQGGIVQGAYGSPQLVMARAGETYFNGFPPSGGSGGGVTIVYSPAFSLADEHEFETKLYPLIERGIIQARRRQV